MWNNIIKNEIQYGCLNDENEFDDNNRFKDSESSGMTIVDLEDLKGENNENV